MEGNDIPARPPRRADRHGNPTGQARRERRCNPVTCPRSPSLECADGAHAGSQSRQAMAHTLPGRLPPPLNCFDQTSQEHRARRRDQFAWRTASLPQERSVSAEGFSLRPVTSDHRPDRSGQPSLSDSAICRSSVTALDSPAALTAIPWQREMKTSQGTRPPGAQPVVALAVGLLREDGCAPLLGGALVIEPTISIYRSRHGLSRLSESIFPKIFGVIRALPDAPRIRRQGCGAAGGFAAGGFRPRRTLRSTTEHPWKPSPDRPRGPRLCRGRMRRGRTLMPAWLPLPRARLWNTVAGDISVCRRCPPGRGTCSGGC